MSQVKGRRFMISIPEVKAALEKIDQEKADQIQKRTLDYAAKFSKTSSDKAREARIRLIEECGLSEAEATEVVNIMPKSVEEMRVFTSGWRKFLPTATVEKILKILQTYS